MVSLVGTWMQSVAQGWLVYELTNSPFALGLVWFATYLPVLLFSLIGGVVADRLDKRKLLLITQTAAMLQALLLGFLTSSGLIQVWQIIVLALALGTINAFDTPTRQAFIVEMVGKEDLMNAIALNSSIFNGARIIGPAIAGGLISTIGVASCFYLNGVAFLAIIFGLLLMRLDKIKREGGISVWKNLTEGLRYVRNNTIALTLVSLVAMASIFGLPYITLLPVFAKDILQTAAIKPELRYSLLMVASGVGALAGALFLASLGEFRRKGWLLTWGNIFFPLILILFSVSRLFPLSLLLLVGVGWGLITQNATANTLLQTIAPDNLRGRVMSIYTLMFMGMIPLGSLQAGAVAEHFGAALAVALGGLICLLFALWLLWKSPQLRHLE